MNLKRNQTSNQPKNSNSQETIFADRRQYNKTTYIPANGCRRKSAIKKNEQWYLKTNYRNIQQS